MATDLCFVLYFYKYNPVSLCSVKNNDWNDRKKSEATRNNQHDVVAMLVAPCFHTLSISINAAGRETTWTSHGHSGDQQ